jgi:hypothetical protein
MSIKLQWICHAVRVSRRESNRGIFGGETSLKTATLKNGKKWEKYLEGVMEKYLGFNLRENG